MCLIAYTYFHPLVSFPANIHNHTWVENPQKQMVWDRLGALFTWSQLGVPEVSQRHFGVSTTLPGALLVRWISTSYITGGPVRHGYSHSRSHSGLRLWVSNVDTAGRTWCKYRAGGVSCQVWSPFGDIKVPFISIIAHIFLVIYNSLKPFAV